ncbi:ETC complex I subunit conserved region-domain-containing protein, partial [Cladochytrium replicatum]
TGVPPEISRRGVRIYRPARTATQQGSNKDLWRIDFDVQQRWENKLMGWSSSGDPVQAAKIEFKTRDDAIMFAERQGYDYWVEEPKEPKFRKKVYADNFTYSADKLRMIRTK